MRHTVLALPLLLAACPPPPAPPAPAWSDADAAALRADHDAAEKLAKEAALSATPDWAGFVAAHYAPDAVVLPPNSAPITGHEAITAYFATITGVTKWETAYTDVMGSGDVGVAVGTYTFEFKLPDGTAGADTGKWMEVFRKGADGHWKTVRDMYNTDLPVPLMAGDAAPTEAPTDATAPTEGAAAPTDAAPAPAEGAPAAPTP